MDTQDTIVSRLAGLHGKNPARLSMVECFEEAALQLPDTPKDKLMCMIPSALYPEGLRDYPNGENASSHTGLFFLDIDVTDNQPEGVKCTPEDVKKGKVLSLIHI